MSKKEILPLNVSILNPSDIYFKTLPKISSLDIFEISSSNFKSNGLYSTEIYGPLGSDRRFEQLAYIDIKHPILHPQIYKILIDTNHIHGEIMSGKIYAIFDKETNSFQISDQVTGRTGYSFFISHINKLELKTTTITQSEKIAVFNKYRDRCLMSKILVLPAGLREIEIKSDSHITEQDINKVYRKLMSVSNTIPDNINKFTTVESKAVFDNSLYLLQITFNEIFNMIQERLTGKKMLIQSKWVSRNIVHSSRNVITSFKASSTKFDDPTAFSFNNTGVGIYQFCKSALPIVQHHLLNGFLSKVFIGNGIAKLVDKNYKLEEVNCKPESYDYWFTSEGLEKVINSYENIEIRDKPIIIEDKYLGLVYTYGDTIELVQDIEALATDSDISIDVAKERCSPITLTQLIYLSIFKLDNKMPAFTSRFPITGQGSIYPTIVYLLTTSKTKTVTYKDIDGATYTLTKYPINTNYINSLVPHTSRIKNLGGDFDGDTNIKLTMSHELSN